MKATFALLTDRETANRVNKAAWHLHQRHHLGIGVRRLPPHVSLKQPFDVDDLDMVEEFAEEFAQSIAPFPITLGGYNLWETTSDNSTSGVLTLQVEETLALRGLHDRLNMELADRFGARPADFDGSGYTFHVTVASGEGTIKAYRQAFDEQTRIAAAPHTFAARELALFVYDSDGDESGDWQYLTYKVLPLGASTKT